jgi:hypothetical protein
MSKRSHESTNDDDAAPSPHTIDPTETDIKMKMKKAKKSSEEKEEAKRIQQVRRDNQYDEIKETDRVVNIDELDEDMNDFSDSEELKDDPIEVSLWPKRVVNELNINGIPSRQQLFDRSFKRLPLLSTIHVMYIIYHYIIISLSLLSLLNDMIE